MTSTQSDGSFTFTTPTRCTSRTDSTGQRFSIRQKAVELVRDHFLERLVLDGTDRLAFLLATHHAEKINHCAHAARHSPFCEQGGFVIGWGVIVSWRFILLAREETAIPSLSSPSCNDVTARLIIHAHSDQRGFLHRGQFGNRVMS